MAHDMIATPKNKMYKFYKYSFLQWLLNIQTKTKIMYKVEHRKIFFYYGEHPMYTQCDLNETMSVKQLQI